MTCRRSTTSSRRNMSRLQTIGSAPNQKLIFMPMEASGVIGAIGGVAELAKSGDGEGQGMNGYQPISGTGGSWRWPDHAETLLPGPFFLWMGISALVLGLVAWLIPAMAGRRS